MDIESLKITKKAEEYYQLSSLMVPCKFYPRYRLFKLYKEMGDTTKANAIAIKIANLPIKIPSETVSIIKEEIEAWLKQINNKH